MNPEDIRKLLGGYATGTLTAAEQEALFTAALEDQELFDALMKEEPLREVLRDPTAKAELLAALEAAPERAAWWRWRPLIGAVAMAGIALAAVAVWRGSHERPAPAMVAEANKPSAPAAALPPQAPGPEPAPAPTSRTTPPQDRRPRKSQERAAAGGRGAVAVEQFAPRLAKQEAQVADAALPVVAATPPAVQQQSVAAPSPMAQQQVLQAINSAPAAGPAPPPPVSNAPAAPPAPKTMPQTRDAQPVRETGTVTGERPDEPRGDGQ